EPFIYRHNDGTILSLEDQKTKIIAVAILIGLVTFIMGGVIAFYIITAQMKAELFSIHDANTQAQKINPLPEQIKQSNENLQKNREAKPLAIFIVGGSGAGKSTKRIEVMNKQIAKQRDFEILDSDEIKKTLPKYKELITKGDPNAANEVHAESIS